MAIDEDDEDEYSDAESESDVEDTFPVTPAREEDPAPNDPFDDFDDDDFDDDFEEEWDDDLPGDEDTFEKDDEGADAPFSDDPDFDE